MAKVRLLDPTDSKRRLDRYELIGELASGGMATVFLARLAGVGGFQRFVAIKRLHPHLASEEEFIEMFLDEARLAAGIHHPHVVPILEVGENESGYYLVMEYIEGDTLARLVARSVAKAKPVPRPVLVRIILDALAGLHAAHELTDPLGQLVELVHRDVSPQNILVGVDGCSRITDFGVARAASRLSNTRADKLKGKLAYMSPEQARSGEVDRRADVFAMGIILWEILAGKRLFKSENEAMTLHRVMVEPIPRLTQLVPSIHPAFEQVCAKALDRDVSKRYQSGAEMAESLERAARTAAVESPTDLGVASPREVAAYVQGALGEDIAAQRESVRAWLAHSQPNLPRVGIRTGEMSAVRAPDVTVKVPLDRSSQSPASSSAPRSVSAVRRAELQVVGELAPHEGVPDDDDEHETLLMDRDAQSALAALGLLPGAPAASVTPPPASAPRFSEEGTQASASLEALAIVPPPAPRRGPQVVALVLGIVITIGGVAIWTKLTAPPPALPPPPAAAAAAPAPTPVAAPTPTPSVTAAPTATASAEVTAAAVQPVKAPPAVGRAPWGRAAAAPEPPKPVDPPKPPEDMPNPYR